MRFTLIEIVLAGVLGLTFTAPAWGSLLFFASGNESVRHQLTVVAPDSGSVVLGPLVAGGAAWGRLGVSPDGERIYALSAWPSVSWPFDPAPARLAIFDSRTGQQAVSREVMWDASGVAVSSDGRYVVVGSSTSPYIGVLDSRSLAGTFVNVQCGPSILLPVKDGVVAACGNRVVRFSLPGLERTAVIPHPADSFAIMYTLAVSPDEAVVFAGYLMYAARLMPYELVSSSLAGGTRWTKPLASRPAAMASSPAGHELYVASADGSNDLLIVSTDTGSTIAAIPLPGSARDMAVTATSELAFVATDLGVVSVDLIDRRVTGIVVSARKTNSLVLAGGPSSLAASAVVIEFHHSGLDHYFMTASEREIADLDSARHPGWTRTGASFVAYQAQNSMGRGQPVCRFAGMTSHFYSAVPYECSQVASQFGRAWELESPLVFEIPVPNLVTGGCPPGTTSVYRLWNGRADSNHRYTTDAAIRSRMLERGYISEGYGSMGVAMCALVQ